MKEVARRCGLYGVAFLKNLDVLATAGCLLKSWLGRREDDHWLAGATPMTRLRMSPSIIQGRQYSMSHLSIEIWWTGL